MSSPDRLYRLGVDHLTGDEQQRELTNPSPKTQELRRQRYEEYLESLDPQSARKPQEGERPETNTQQQPQNEQSRVLARHQRAKLNGWERVAVVGGTVWFLVTLVASWDNKVGNHYSLLGFVIVWSKLVMFEVALAPGLLWMSWQTAKWVIRGFRNSPHGD